MKYERRVPYFHKKRISVTSLASLNKGQEKKECTDIAILINGMLRHLLGAVVLISLQHFIAPALDLLPCLQARGTRDCNKGSKFKKGAMKCCKENKIIALTLMRGLFNKMDSRREVKFTSSA